MLEKLHWGLVPRWAKDISTGYKMINARSGPIATKSSFRDAFKKRRCLILADGFYEWAGKKGNKQPVFITLSDEKPFAFAGLRETWHDKDHQGCSLSLLYHHHTGSRHLCLKYIHDRMPAILHPETYEAWP